MIHSKPHRGQARTREPMAPDLMHRAKQIADQYRLLLELNERGVYRGSAVELPGSSAHGATPDECVQRTRQALVAAVAALLEAGKTPPLPARINKRDEQINIRVSAEEKLMLEAAARQNGFRNVSEYIRRRAIEGTV